MGDGGELVRLAAARPCQELLELQPRVGDVVQALVLLFLEAASQQPDQRRGVPGGSACQSGSRSRTAATVSEKVAPSNARFPASISKSTQPKAHTSLRRSSS